MQVTQTPVTKVHSSETWIVRIGLCAAASVLVASLGILMFQGMHGDSSALHDLEPAQIQSAPSVSHALPTP